MSDAAAFVAAVVAGAADAEAVVSRLGDSDHDVRRAALQALDGMDPAAVALHARALAERLGDGRWAVRRCALEALGKLLGEYGYDYYDYYLLVDAIVKPLTDEDERVRRAALRALGRLAGAEGARRPTASEAIDRLDATIVAPYVGDFVELLGDGDDRVHDGARALLACVDPRVLTPHSERLAQWLKDSEGRVRRAALETLGRLVPEEIGPHLQGIVERLADDDARVRQAVLDTLCRVDPAVLMERMCHEDERVRQAMAEALCFLPPEVKAAWLGPVVHQLGDRDEHVREKARCVAGAVADARRARAALGTDTEAAGG